MIFLSIGVAILIMVFLGTVLFGAPFVPTHRKSIPTIIELVPRGKNSKLIDLGCGDGRLLVAAAKSGISSVGYEINPFLWAVAKIKTRPYKRMVSVYLGDYKRNKWPENIGSIYIFGSNRELRFIKKRILTLKRPIRVMSYGFGFSDLKPNIVKDGVLVFDFK